VTTNIMLTHIDEATVTSLRIQAETLGIQPGEYIARLMTLHAWAESLTLPDAQPYAKAAALLGLRTAQLR
jgi:hypothetical protein